MSGTYRAVARSEGRYWVVEVEGVGITQGRSLHEARDMALDLVLAVTGSNADGIDFAVELADGLDEQVRLARQATAEAEAKQREAAQATRDVVARLRRAGLTGKDTAAVLGVSEQRVSQLLAKDPLLTEPKAEKQAG